MGAVMNESNETLSAFTFVFQDIFSYVHLRPQVDLNE